VRQPVAARLPLVTAAPSVHRPAPGAFRAAEPPAAQEVVAAAGTPAPVVPKVFKTLGYVEKAGEQLEAIILQENQMQVVHIGDLIAEKFRVTKVSPEEVAAVDVEQAQVSVPEPKGASENDLAANAGAQAPARALPPEPLSGSLGYVEKSDGKVEAVMADGDTVRLVPASAATLMAQAAPVALPPAPVASAPAPVAEEAPAPLAAVASTTVEAAAGNPATRDAISALLPDGVAQEAAYRSVAQPAGAEASAEGGGIENSAARENESIPGSENLVMMRADSSLSGPLGAPSGGGVALGSDKMTATFKPLGYVTQADGQLSAILPDGDSVAIVRQGDRFAGHLFALSVAPDAVIAVEDPPPRRAPSLPALTQPSQRAHSGTTFVFQTLGTVQDNDGELQAIVADGSQRYLVKQGDTFAGGYQVTSVDSLLVLAVRAVPEASESPPSFQTESGGPSASKHKNGNPAYPLAGLANAQAGGEIGAAGGSSWADLGLDLLTSGVPGLDLGTQLLGGR